MAPENRKLEEYSEPQKLSVFGGQICPELKNLEGFVSKKGIRRTINQ